MKLLNLLILGTDLVLYRDGMLKIIVFVTYFILLPLAWGNPSETIYLQPIHPDSQPSTNDLQILDNDLRDDLIRLSQERTAYDQQKNGGYIPYYAMGEFDNTRIFQRVLDKSLNRFLKSDFFKKSEVGKTSEQVKNNLKTDMEFSDEKNIQHKFNFKVQAFQNLAYISYQGFTQARLRYNYKLKTMALTFDHTLSPTSSISIDHSFQSGIAQDFVYYNRWW